MTADPNGSAITPFIKYTKGSRPKLLAANRRLRHLRGLSLRNLALGSPTDHSHRRSVDDGAVPHALQTPAKLLAVREESSLSHSQSFPDLKLHTIVNATPEIPSSKTPPSRKSSHSSSKRPRATLQRANTSPRQRKQNLRDVLLCRIGNVFFSLHCEVMNDPIYISETVRDTMNHDFRFFDLNAYGSSVTRLESMTLRVWANARDSEEWSLIVNSNLNMQQLQFIGKDLEDIRYSFRDNAVLFHLSDGIYILSTIGSDDEVDDSALPVEKPSSRLEATSSYDALMRLSTLEQCIQDSFATRRRIAGDIQNLIDQSSLRSAVDDRLAEARNAVAAMTRAVAMERKQAKVGMNKIDELRKTLKARRDAISEGKAVSERTIPHLQENIVKLEHCRETYKQTIDSINGQRRRICEDLLEIYPINPIPNRSLAFKIHGTPLPNSVFQDAKEDVISAALGHVAHVVYLLSFYLSVPLPYQVYPSSSTSYITDPISLMVGSRAFPLYMKGSVFYRFEYGVFLLNKNIELLASHLGLKILDIRQTLPNLKYVLFVATAGQGELPARKAGGVRGLLMREGEKNLLDGSRGTSPDSFNAARTANLRSIAALRTTS